jgi:hypothetical protein
MSACSATKARVEYIELYEIPGTWVVETDMSFDEHVGLR